MFNNETLNAVDAELMSRFDQTADSYDSQRYLSHAGMFFNELEVYVVNEWTLGGRGSRGLDIPCGTGRLTISLAHRCEEVVAGDISTQMIAIAQERTSHQGVTNVTFQQVNGRKLPFSENTFDTIICFNFLHLIPNDQKGELITEFSRVLKIGGKLIVEFNSPLYGLFLGLLRYRRRLGEIPRRCFFPGQGRRLFRGYRKGHAVGIGFPFLWLLARIFGKNVMMKVSLTLGRIPVLRFLAYAIVFELYKEKK